MNSVENAHDIPLCMLQPQANAALPFTLPWKVANRWSTVEHNIPRGVQGRGRSGLCNTPGQSSLLEGGDTHTDA